MLSIFLTFGYAIIVFNLVNLRKIHALYRSTFLNAKIVLQMNIFILFNWLSTFMSLHYLDPSTALCINLGILSITIFFISIPLHKLKENKKLGYSVLLVLFSMTLIVRQHINMLSQLLMRNVAFGLFWCALGGVTGAFIGISSESMGKAGFSITQILATRFYLLTLVSCIALFYVPHVAINTVGNITFFLH